MRRDEGMTSVLTEKEFSRADFLKGSGALVVGFSVPMTLARKAAGATGAAGAIGPALIDPKLVDSWIAIDSAGKVTVLTGKVELGTGILTATMQIAAEELDVAFSSVRIVEGDTWRTPDQGTTAGCGTDRGGHERRDAGPSRSDRPDGRHVEPDPLLSL
jgi:nicotinate dehydrogenase subunit B